MSEDQGPRPGQGGASDGESAAYSTVDLRRRLRGLAMRLSPQRRLAAIAPLVLALGSWFVVPSFADYHFVGSGRVAGEVNSAGDLAVYSKFAPTNGGYQTFARGYRAAGYFELADGGATIDAYCISVSHQHNPSASMREANAAGPQLSYILSHQAPAVQAAGALDSNAEAAAVQLAIWSYTDDSLSHPVHGSDAWIPSVEARARAIVADTDANSAAWWAGNSAEHHLSAMSFDPPGGVVQAPGAVGASVSVLDAAGHSVAVPGARVHWTVAGGQFTNGGQTLDQTVDTTGGASVQIRGSVGTNAVIRAQLAGESQASGIVLTPVNAPGDQNLVYLKHLPKDSPPVSGEVRFTSTPPPTPPPTAPPPAPSPPPAPATAPCIPPSPTVSINGPPVLSPGAPATYTVAAGNIGATDIGPNTLTVTLPDGFQITGEQPSGDVSGPTITYPIAALPAKGGQTMTVSATIPVTQQAGQVQAQAALQSTPQQAAGCPPAQANTMATTSGVVGGVAGDVQGITAGGPMQITSPTFITAATPGTGAAQGVIRGLSVGICLILSGLVVLTGLRRNPHGS